MVELMQQEKSTFGLLSCRSHGRRRQGFCRWKRQVEVMPTDADLFLSQPVCASSVLAPRRTRPNTSFIKMLSNGRAHHFVFDNIECMVGSTVLMVAWQWWMWLERNDGDAHSPLYCGTTATTRIEVRVGCFWWAKGSLIWHVKRTRFFCSLFLAMSGIQSLF